MAHRDPDVEILGALLRGAVQRDDTHPGTAQAQKFRRNWRMNVAEAFEATYAASKIAYKLIAATGSLGILAALLLDVPEDVRDLWSAGIKAISESMDPLAYSVCVVLSSHDAGLKPDPLRDELGIFLRNCAMKDVSAWVRLSTDQAGLAYKQLTNEPFDKMLDDMVTEGWLMKSSGLYTVAPRHFVWGFDAGT